MDGGAVPHFQCQSCDSLRRTKHIPKEQLTTVRNSGATEQARGNGAVPRLCIADCGASELWRYCWLGQAIESVCGASVLQGY
jgi:hypothetical protein